MHPVFSAVRSTATESFAMLRAAIEDLPDDAFDWTPAPNTSSLSVLLDHVRSSTRFWVASGAGLTPSRKRYIDAERPAAFEARGATAADSVAELTAALAEIESLLASGDTAAIEGTVSWPDDDSLEPRPGVYCLVHSMGHLREHVGQVQLMRDLWLAKEAGG